MAFTRRSFIQAAGSGLGAAALGFPVVVRAQTEPIRVGLMTVKTGPLASGGIDMERALVQFLRERNNTLAGRKVELFVADSAGVPAQARTKLQELVERNRIQVMIGPLAAGRSARRRRLHPVAAAPDAVGRRRRGLDPAQPQSLVRSRDVDFLAVRSRRWPTIAPKRSSTSAWR